MPICGVLNFNTNLISKIQNGFLLWFYWSNTFLLLFYWNLFSLCVCKSFLSLRGFKKYFLWSPSLIALASFLLPVWILLLCRVSSLDSLIGSRIFVCELIVKAVLWLLLPCSCKLVCFLTRALVSNSAPSSFSALYTLVRAWVLLSRSGSHSGSVTHAGTFLWLWLVVMVQTFLPHSRLAAWLGSSPAPCPLGRSWDLCSCGSYQTYSPMHFDSSWNCRVSSFDSFIFRWGLLFLVCDSLIFKQHFINFEISKVWSINSVSQEQKREAAECVHCDFDPVIFHNLLLFLSDLIT